MACQRTFKIMAVVCMAVIFIILGICSILVWKTIYQRLLVSQLTIEKHSTGYEMWKETPIPMYFNVYLFNWTNADEVLNNWKIKPVFNECGPYVFSEHHVRVNVTWNDHNGTVSYQQRRIWKFLPEQSNGSLSDNITNLNVIASTVSYKVRNKWPVMKKFVEFYIELKEKGLIVTKTADEWMFSGYEDKLLEMIANLNISIGITDTKFGWFYGRNNSETYDGNFTMFTGRDDIELLGIIDRWNGSPVTSYYDGYCAVVNGTSGELWPPVNKYNNVAIFSPDLCSTLWISHENTTEEIEGLEGKKFVANEYNFDNGTRYPEQKCFINDVTYPSGVRDVSKCKFGAPAFVSYPHFYKADPIYRRSIGGMRPNQKEHEFFILLEPNTGIPLHVHAAMQINLLIEPISSMKMFENVKRTFVPMLWFSQTAKLTKKYANKTKLLLTVPSLMIYSGYGLIGVAMIIILATVYITHRKTWIGREGVHLLAEES